MKKALALILTLIMVLGLMPAAMAATDDPRQSVTKTENDIVINKSIHPNTDGSYALTIEAYATGTSSTTTQSVPLDIVLVLDVSGSMKDAFGGEYVAQEKEYKKSDFGFLSDTLYYKYTDNYYPVYYDWDYNLTDGIKYVLYFYDSSNTVHYLTSDGNLADSPTYLSEDQTLYKGVLYKLTSPSKMNVLKSAVNKFIDTVAADASKNNVNHQIAIVKFAGTMKQDVGNDKYKEGQYSYNYSQTVVGLTDVNVSGNKDTLKEMVSELTHGGATAADYGMQLANGLLSESQEGRKQIVVMFTDGEPNHGNGFDEDVANAAISAAKAMKDSKVTVYTIGAIQQPSDRVKNFLDYTSSNYPDAQSMSTVGTKAAEKYYKIVNTDTALAGIFETIASETTQTSAAANASSVLEDKLTGYFNFANFSDGNITGYTVMTAACTGEDTWGTPAEASGVSVSVNGNDNDTIDITGFDYTSADNLVVNKDGKWRGNKLIVTFNIVLDESAEGWQAGRNRVPTNADGFACIKGQDDQKLIALTESPEVDVYAYEVKYEVNGPAPTAHSDIPQAKVYLAGKTGKTVPVAGDLTTAETSNNGQAGVWTFNGWKKDEEGIQTIQIPDGPAADGNYTITIIGTWTFAPTEQFGSLTIAKDFKFEGEATEARPDSITFTVQQIVQEGEPGHSETVTLTPNDSWKKTIDNVPVGEYTVTEGDATIEGYSCTPAKNPDGNINVVANEIAAVTFTNTYKKLPPDTKEITFNVSKTVEQKGNVAPGTNTFNFVFTIEGSEDAAINNSDYIVTIGGNTITPDATGKYGFPITVNGATTQTVQVMVQGGTAKIDNIAGLKVSETGTAPEYWTYDNKEAKSAQAGAAATFTNTYTKMEDNTGSLTVKKTVSGGGASYNKEFTFTVTLTEDNDPQNGEVTYGGVTFTDGVATFTLKHNQEKSITGIPAGYTYTVTENADGYTQSITSGSATGTIEKGKTATVTFNNYKSGGDHYYPTPDPVPPIVIPPNTGDMTIWQSILHFLGIR